MVLVQIVQKYPRGLGNLVRARRRKELKFTRSQSQSLNEKGVALRGVSKWRNGSCKKAQSWQCPTICACGTWRTEIPCLAGFSTVALHIAKPPSSIVLGNPYQFRIHSRDRPRVSCTKWRSGTVLALAWMHRLTPYVQFSWVLCDFRFKADPLSQWRQ